MAERLTVRDLLDFLDAYAPFSLAEKWDNVGLMVGDPSMDVSGILVALDPTLEVFDEALAVGCNTIICHHPLLFHPLKQVLTNTVQGRLLRRALRHDLQIIACHTNLDVISGGVSDALAARIGLTSTRPLVPCGGAEGCGFGRIGTLAQAMTGLQLVAHLASCLGQPDILVAGSLPEKIEQVAVCGGSCGELGPQAQNQGAQVFITAEVKHSQARWAEDAGFCMVDCGHYSTENVVVAILSTRLAAHVGADLLVRTTAAQRRPLRAVVS